MIIKGLTAGRTYTNSTRGRRNTNNRSSVQYVIYFPLHADSFISINSAINKFASQLSFNFIVLHHTLLRLFCLSVYGIQFSSRFSSLLHLFSLSHDGGAVWMWHYWQRGTMLSLHPLPMRDESSNFIADWLELCLFLLRQGLPRAFLVWLSSIPHTLLPHSPVNWANEQWCRCTLFRQFHLPPFSFPSNDPRSGW